ncbi:hypothetical protein DET49_11898 [Salegentibacter sp. 24]|nr:hypothetical protein DET49_11898 [Salegentibacter sp. 24]
MHKTGKITRKLLFEFGVGLGLSKKQIEGAFKRFQELKTDAKFLIESSFLSGGLQEAYINILEQRYNVLINEK